MLVSELNRVFFTAQDSINCLLKSYDLTEETFEDLNPCYFNSESRTLSWNKKMNSLYFSQPSKENKTAIHQLELSKGTITKLTNPNSINEQDWSPQISPNQQWLSFSRGTQSVRNIWLKNMKTGNEQALTHGEHYSVSHTWYDTEHIVFDSDMSGSRQLWVVDIYDVKPQLLGAYGAQHPSFDDDREVMTFQEVSYEANIWLYDISSGDFSRVVHSTKYDNYPAFSADGRRFLFSSNRQDLSSIWLFDMDREVEQLLISKPGSKLTRPSWSQSEHQVLMTINDDSGYGSLLLDLNTMETEVLNFGYGHTAAVEFEGAYFALAKSDELQHKILRLSNQQTEVLPVDAVSRFMLLDDGGIILSKNQIDGLFLYDLKTQQETLLIPEFKSASMNLWTVVNQMVYFDRGGDLAGIWRLNLNTDELTFITSHRPFSVGTSLSVNSAETQILITRTDRAESDILKTYLK